LISANLVSGTPEVLDVSYSDHCPIAIDIDTPPELELIEPQKPVLSVEIGRAV
jgi:hypothetical protein